MANDRLSALSRYDFLVHPDALSVFGKLDYQLKDGVHFQNRPHQRISYEFIEDNYNSLSNYYDDYFKVRLDSGGEGPDRYFYLDFLEANFRGRINADHRHFLASEYVVVGFLLYKVHFIDLQIDLDSVARFQKTIREDYEELKPLIYEKLAHVTRKKPGEIDDEKVNNVISAAIKEFAKIGWIDLQDDYFDILPAFQRLTKVYGNAINEIDSWQSSR
ncbi:hypothetical protein GCM10028808_27220 [Spirosoma migulaei]